MTPTQVIAAISAGLNLIERLADMLDAFDDGQISADEMRKIRDRAEASNRRLDQRARRLGIID